MIENRFKLKFDQNIVEFLKFYSNDSIIAQILLQGDSQYLVNEGNYIKRESCEIDVISFLPNSKLDKIENVWEEGRVKIRIGRFIRKFINEFSLSRFSIDDKAIESFVNMYKSFFERDVSRLKIVSGADILKYYCEDTYFHINGNRFGTLWNSCMRQKERNKFMKLYAQNPESVKMLIFFSDNNKVRARALLWDSVKDHNSSKEYKFMDRIYYFYDHDVNFLKDWAKENGYIAKWEQNAKTEIYFDDWSGRPVKMHLYVNLKIDDLLYFPYLDTFKFLNVHLEMARFSNSENARFDYILIQSNGMLERERRDPEPEMAFLDVDDGDA